MGPQLSETFYGIKIGRLGAKLQHFKVAPFFLDHEIKLHVTFLTYYLEHDTGCFLTRMFVIGVNTLPSVCKVSIKCTKKQTVKPECSCNFDIIKRLKLFFS